MTRTILIFMILCLHVSSHALPDSDLLEAKPLQLLQLNSNSQALQIVLKSHITLSCLIPRELWSSLEAATAAALRIEAYASNDTGYCRYLTHVTTKKLSPGRITLYGTWANLYSLQQLDTHRYLSLQVGSPDGMTKPSFPGYIERIEKPNLPWDGSNITLILHPAP